MVGSCGKPKRVSGAKSWKVVDEEGNAGPFAEEITANLSLQRPGIQREARFMRGLPVLAVEIGTNATRAQIAEFGTVRIAIGTEIGEGHRTQTHVEFGHQAALGIVAESLLALCSKTGAGSGVVKVKPDRSFEGRTSAGDSSMLDKEIAVSRPR